LSPLKRFYTEDVLTTTESNRAIFPCDTLASGRFGGFLKKNTKTHVVLHGNFSSPVSAIDPVKRCGKSCSLHSKKIFWSGCGFFVSDVISGGLLGSLGLLLAWAQTVRSGVSNLNCAEGQMGTCKIPGGRNS